MRSVIYILNVLVSIPVHAQSKKAADYGFRHFQMIYEKDTVDILIKSKKGEENKKKPLFLFCQGSQAQPLIKYSEHGVYGIFPFRTDSLESVYHLAIISKPYIPLIADAKTLDRSMVYNDPVTGLLPKKYSDRNYLDYYVSRNISAIKYLQQQKFVDSRTLVVAGHSEGSTIAAKLALQSSKVTRLIYASGNPLGRIQSIINEDRLKETDTDSTRYAEADFDYWEQIVQDKNSLDASSGDTPKATYDFSYPPIKYLEQLKIPVLVCYGTRDISSPFNDYLRAEMIRQRKANFTFKAYIGLEHNFFPIMPTGQIDHDQFNWDDVANDWLRWTRR